ncbi:SH2 domain-containing protein 4B-like isoform X2 [Saccostrea echinata]|uniref:SH2 domain-containing protein 4B-like isoform X2 n=1 Tax=Saccostrea echinata TaxID=191078 RepID=UPI002A82293E|nr:SH2 domain-containing protein 4B-like isoform X2 [Saccostrea echinata]
MLRQILQTMTVDPDLLAELSDEQKAVLFVKIREEQVRRYDEHEKNNQIEKIPRKPKKGKKMVEFLQGKDGKEWVWVMGEHKNDKSIEELIELEWQEKALKEAEREIEEIRRREEAEIAKRLEEEKEKLEMEQKHKEEELRKQREEAELYASLKQAREVARKLEEEKQKAEEEEKIRVEQLRHRIAEDKRQSLERLVKKKNRRSSEIFTEYMSKREEMEKIAEQNLKEVESNWQEQEKKAKKAEEEVKELARRARIEYQNSLKLGMNVLNAVSAFSGNGTNTKPPVPPKSEELRKSMAKVINKRPPRPPNKQAVIEWFLEEERPKGVGTDLNTGKVAAWFHGVISRLEAENYLLNMTLGSFLVRVSERVWGYTISYRAEDRCKHFLIDTSDQGYQFFGANQLVHRSLAELINFHKSNPITVTGGELLRTPVGQIKEPPDYQELMRPRITESTAL